MQRIFGGIYWHPTLLRALVATICLAGAVWLVMEHFNPAPPSTITIATGAKGGAYEFFAQQYREKLVRAHVRLNIRITDGTAENIRLIEDPKSGVQVAFVVGGASNSREAPGLLSLGRVNYQVFWLFYRGHGDFGPLDATQGQTHRGWAGRSCHPRTSSPPPVSMLESATLLPFTGSAGGPGARSTAASMPFSSPWPRNPQSSNPSCAIPISD